MSILSQTKEIYAQRGLKRAALYWWHANRARRLAEDWLAYLHTLPLEIPVGIRQGLAQKIFRPYLRRRLGAAARMEILCEHYDLITRKIAPAHVAEILAQPGMQLATLTGKSGRTYSVHLGSSTTKEGDADIFFMDDHSGAPLATLTGVFGLPDGKSAFYIGGLRGIKPPLGKAEIVFATRDLHGLRPKHAVLQAACRIAAWFGAETLIAPTQKNHITWRFGFASREILADYDAFWQEFTAVRRTDGDYGLPTELPRREAAEVKSKKRAEWTRRQALLEDMIIQIPAALGAAAIKSESE